MKKANLFIWWAPTNAFWVESGMTSLMNLRLPQWTEAWEKPYDPLQYLITRVELHIYKYTVYLLQTVIAYTADKWQALVVLFCFKSLHHSSYRNSWLQLRIICIID